MIQDAIFCMEEIAGVEVCENCRNYDRCDHMLIEENARYAIEALEKQIPKKPGRNIFDDDSMTCICGSDIDKNEEFRFCPWCGQRITDI